MNSPLRARLRDRLTDARRARDADLAGALRSAIAALENAEAVAGDPGPTDVTSHEVAGAVAGLGSTEADRRELDASAERTLVEREITELVTAAEQYAVHGRQDEAAGAERSAAVLRELVEEPRG
jgi:uncharacterized protein YqeY